MIPLYIELFPCILKDVLVHCTISLHTKEFHGILNGSTPLSLACLEDFGNLALDHVSGRTSEARRLTRREDSKPSPVA